MPCILALSNKFVFPINHKCCFSVNNPLLKQLFFLTIDFQCPLTTKSAKFKLLYLAQNFPRMPYYPRPLSWLVWRAQTCSCNGKNLINKGLARYFLVTWSWCVEFLAQASSHHNGRWGTVTWWKDWFMVTQLLQHLELRLSFTLIYLIK